jgi:SAM-dependent methyltransferase
MKANNAAKCDLRNVKRISAYRSAHTKASSPKVYVMESISSNKDAWNRIGEDVASPYIKDASFYEVFSQFCASLPVEGSVLDIGCGPGLPFTREFVRRGFMTTGIDISDTMVEAARKNVPDASFVCTSMTDIDFVEQFDGVFSSYAMICLRPHDFFVAAMKIVKALKENGLLFIAINEPSPGHLNHENVFNIWRRIRTNNPLEGILREIRRRTRFVGAFPVMGKLVYSSPYTELEVRDAFCRIGMKMLRLERKLIWSKAYGNEHMLITFMQKIVDPALK